MTISWDKPQKIRTSEEHGDIFSSDTGVHGTYVPNMSTEDMNKWKGTIKYKTTDHPFIELRKTFNRDHCYAQMFVIVALNGYKYKNDLPETSKSTNVRISCNGPVAMDLNDWCELNENIQEATAMLMLKKY